MYSKDAKHGSNNNGDGENPDKSASGGASGKSWYQVSRVSDDNTCSYNLLGYEFRSPQIVFVNFVTRYMGGVIKEVFLDEKVNQEGLNFLDRTLKHP